MLDTEMEFPNICPYCGEMVKNVTDYLDNHLAKHFPVAGRQYSGKKNEIDK